MTLTQLAPPYPIFTDKNGDPLDAGYLYFGTANLNPETNPIQVYYDSALTQPAAQPLRTSNGYVMRNGTPALIYGNSQFSVTVRNKNNELVIYSPVGYGILPGTSATSTDQITYNEGSTGAVSRILTARLQDYVSVKDFGAVGDGITDDTAAIQAAIDALALSGGGRLVLSPGVYLTSSVIYIKSGVHVEGAGYGATEIFSNFPLVSGTKGIIRSAAFAFDGENPDDDYTTYYSATGDYFTTGPRPFVASFSANEGARSFTAASVADVSDLSNGDWVYLSEGIPSWHPAKSEFVQVESVLGASVTVKTNMRNGYSNGTTSLGAFIRSYDLTVNPGGGVGGYPNMHTWSDAGFRKITPIVNASLTQLTIRVIRNIANAKIAWITHLAHGIRIDTEIIGGTFWNIDSQDITLRVRGGSTGSMSSYVGNGCNGVVCDIDLTNQVAIEEGAQNVFGCIKSHGYNTIKDYVAQCDLTWTASSGSGVPGIECSVLRDVTLRPSVTAGNAAVRNVTPSLSSIATNLPQVFLTGEVARYFTTGLTLIGGECISTGSSTSSLETVNGGQIRCIDTVVPAVQISRIKGSTVVDGRRTQQTVATFPLYNDLEVGELFHSNTYGAVEVVGVKQTTVVSQFNFPGTLNCLIIDNFSVGGIPKVGDIIVFRLSDSAASVVNWSWHVAQITKISSASAAVEYSPPNPVGKTAITAANEDAILIFRTSISGFVPVVKTVSASWESEGGGFISGIGRLAGGPLQLGTYQLWVDSTGVLRIKNGAPTTDTDGTVVGTQT